MTPIPRNLQRFPELHPAFDAPSAVTEANRCLYCFDAPCAGACPTHIDVPRFIKKISTGNLRGAARTILDANILGLSCSRVCPVEVLCEGACVLHQQNRKPIEIARLQRHALEHGGVGARELLGAQSNSLPRLPGVACIGGGPASLACAAELRLRGYRVTIFDDRPLPGGLNTYGVAEYKLRPADSLREVEMIRALGVEFRQASVGDGVSLDDLESSYALIFLGLGLGSMQRLGIPGEDLGGVIDALRFIERYKTSHDMEVGRRVIIIGGGNTAIDAANAARRLGADQVHVFYRRTEREMPAFRSEYDHSKIEGVRFHWLAQPTGIVGVEGRAAAVKFTQTQLGEPDAAGRSSAVAVAGSEFEVACDMVIPAVGQSRLADMLHATRAIQVRKGIIQVDRPTGRTSNPRYYAGGDCVNGGREVVDAVADGKRAAIAMAAGMEAQRG
jgi:dihydropyrimidine dehydrogenase (NAD+) subunit PreT